MIAIFGAGMAGLASAISAARRKSDVCLVEKTSRIGGTVVCSSIHTLAGFFDEAGKPINRGLSVELIERLIRGCASAQKRQIGRFWVLYVPASDLAVVLNKWVREEKRIEVFLESRYAQSSVKNKTLKKIVFFKKRARIEREAKACIDATGNAEIIGVLDNNLLIHDRTRSAGGMIVQLRNVGGDILTFPNNVGVLHLLRKAVKDGHLPPECRFTILDKGLQEDEIFIKLFIPFGGCYSTQKNAIRRLTRKAHSTRDLLVAFLRRIDPFCKATVGYSGDLGIRDGDRMKGEYILSALDIMNARKFPDRVCRCCWPMEYWDAVKGPIFTLVPEGDYYEVPLRSLKARGLRNIWSAGKCISADIQAQSSIRVSGCCWATGEAAGYYATIG